MNVKKLKLGNIVSAVFLGEKYKCEVIKVIDKDTYRLKTNQGTILPHVTWKDKCEHDKKGKLLSVWYIENIIK